MTARTNFFLLTSYVLIFREGVANMFTGYGPISQLFFRLTFVDEQIQAVVIWLCFEDALLYYDKLHGGQVHFHASVTAYCVSQTFVLHQIQFCSLWERLSNIWCFQNLELETGQQIRSKMFRILALYFFWAAQKNRISLDALWHLQGIFTADFVARANDKKILRHLE